MGIGWGWGGEYKIKLQPIKNLGIIFLTFHTPFLKTYSKFNSYGVGSHGALNPWRILSFLVFTGFINKPYDLITCLYKKKKIPA